MSQPLTEHLEHFHNAARLNLFFRARLAARGIAVDTIDIVRVQHRPKAGVTGVYRVRGSMGGRAIEHHYGMTTESLTAQERHDVVQTHYAGIPVSVWRHPTDPRLPGLPLATDPGTLCALWPDAFPTAGELDLSWRTYRPLRRAVLHAQYGAQEAYLKVLTLKRAGRLGHIHRIMADAKVPTARLVGEPKAGIVPLAALPGRPMTDYLFSWNPDVLDRALPLAELVQVLDDLPTELTTLRPRSAWADGIGAFTRSAAAAFPHLAPRLRRVRKHLRKRLAKTDRGPVVPTHGDFYEANIFLTEGPDQSLRFSGLLDLDTMGPGHRVDDLACLLGHLAVLPSVHPDYRRIEPLTARWWQVCAGLVDERALQLRAAAVALTLIAGTKHAPAHKAASIAEQRLTAVEEILEGKRA
ncbi:phosphotransferase [Micrococcoides hystricis]|uniref:Phosphotransferase n=1 Tax=Micrococcoides hystricis TaxID=1572761 RepID=A0ABV6P9Z2_9MICC